VASERQIAANRRNACNSTGPRSGAGKKRASNNSYRHGLTSSVASSAELAKSVEKLAREIAADATDAVTLEYARAAAQAEFDLARIRQVKVAMIERMSAFGELEAPEAFKSVNQIKRFLNAFDRGEMIIPEPVEAAATMPSTEPERTAEAVRRALPELLKLDRYERRAAARRERSAGMIVGRVK
jgi:hypothetical protein